MNATSIKYAWILPFAFSISTVFAQRNNNQQGRGNQSNQNQGTRQTTPNRGNNQPAQNNRPTTTGGNNNRVVATQRSGPGSFRTPVNGGNPVRIAYNGAPRFTPNVPTYGQRVTKINASYRTIAYGGRNYRYNNGVFYNPVGSLFQVIFPPIGIHINVLPLGYRRIYVGTNPYYYYNGVFYNGYQNNEYVVVDPPIGAKLPELPAGAKLVTINGQPYYELDGTYYVEEYNINNEVLYTVVGVHGTLNDALVSTPVIQSNAVKTLPADCRKVNINGQVLYMAPDGTYFQEILDSYGTISYQVVGSVSN